MLAADAYVWGANIVAPDSNIIRKIRKYKTILRKYFAKSIFKIVFYFVFSKYFLKVFCPSLPDRVDLAGNLAFGFQDLGFLGFCMANRFSMKSVFEDIFKLFKDIFNYLQISANL